MSDVRQATSHVISAVLATMLFRSHFRNTSIEFIAENCLSRNLQQHHNNEQKGDFSTVYHRLQLIPSPALSFIRVLIVRNDE